MGVGKQVPNHYIVLRKCIILSGVIVNSYMISNTNYYYISLCIMWYSKYKQSMAQNNLKTMWHIAHARQKNRSVLYLISHKFH